MTSTTNRPIRAGAAALAMLVLLERSANAQQLEPIRYTLRIPAPQTHYIDVEATYPTAGMPVVELMMAVWTPGSYLVREFARHVEDVHARDRTGRALPIEKSRKNRWRVRTNGADAVAVTYRVYAHERQARTNWVEDSFALINGAPTYLTMLEKIRRPHEVALELPPAWSKSVTSLPATADGRPHHYRASDFDALVDSPIVAGNPVVYEFTVGGIPHALVNTGEHAPWDGARAARDVERIVKAARELWGFLPYDRYLFLNLLTEQDDGIEHKNSTVLFASRSAMVNETSYHDWLLLVAHEYFHAWNVKRLRPIELGPFDYENEVYTRSLWVAEGLSDYYSWLLVRRAGLGSQEQALADLSGAVETLQATPGRLVQPLELASYDAWIRQYRPDENSANVSVSYYTKGSVVGALLDATIRRLTNNARSLDDVLRLAYRRYSGERGYTPAELRRAAAEIAGTSLEDVFHRALETTEELSYAEMLDWYGLRRTTAPQARPRATLGLDTRDEDGRVIISRVLRGTPAHASGLSPDDELIAINDVRLGRDGLAAGLERYQPGDTVTVLVARRGELRSLRSALGASPGDGWSLAVHPDATDDQKRHLAAWLGGDLRR
jgi:predicted metalloprotease with PDZ domain